MADYRKSQLTAQINQQGDTIKKLAQKTGINESKLRGALTGHRHLEPNEVLLFHEHTKIPVSELEPLMLPGTLIVFLKWREEQK